LEPKGVRRSSFILLLLAMALFYFSALETVPLLEPDEGRYAEIPREMLTSGDFVTPHLNGVVYLEKPPLYYWGNALSLKLFGENEFGARAFTAAVSVAGILLTYWMAAILGGVRTGLFSAIVLSTCCYYYAVGRTNTLDMTLAVTLMLAIFPAYLYLSGKRGGRRWLLISYAGAALAFLTKGLIGIVFPAIILSLWMLATRRHRSFANSISLTGIFLFLAISLPWVLLAQKHNPDFSWFFFVHEHFLRYATTVHKRSQPFWFFLPIVLGGFVPWIALLPRAIAAARKSAGKFLNRDDLVFLLSWSLFIFVFFSFSRSKLPTYVAPIFPPLSVLMGRTLDLWSSHDDGRGPCWFPLALCAVLVAGCLLLPHFAPSRVELGQWARLIAVPAALLLIWGIIPLFIRRLAAERVILLCFLVLALAFTSLNRPAGIWLGKYKSVKWLCATLSASLRPGDIIAQYGTYKQGIPFYTKSRTVLVNELDELAFGADRASDRREFFISEEEFSALWRSPRRVFCVFRKGAYRMIRERFPDHLLLYRSEEGILIVNRI
jgi:4-amino-4-deoxy-L-arabinose transferase-like glycosyltransferase